MGQYQPIAAADVMPVKMRMAVNAVAQPAQPDGVFSSAKLPVTLNIRSGRIRSCREGARGSRIAERLVPDRLGWVPGVVSMSSLCGDAVAFAGVWPRLPKAFAALVG